MLAVKAALPRVVLWDSRHEYAVPRAVICETPAQFAQALLTRPGPWIFRPSFDEKECRAQFDAVCRAILALQSDALQARLLFAIEEASEIITSPGHPPALLRKMAVQSRHYGLSLLLAGQRPLFIDTTMRGSATVIRCGRLGYAGDCKVMGEWLGVDPRELQNLPDRTGFLMERGKLTRF